MKTLHLSIIAIFLVFAGLLLSYDDHAYGIWVRQSPQELIDQSSTIFVGNITSVNIQHLQKAQFYTMEVNGTDKNFVRNYTLNLDEYSVDVSEFLKNPQNTNKITVRQPTIGLPTGLGALGGFKAGDRVLFYIKNLDGINEYSPESFVIPQFCIAKDVLTQKRVEGSNNFTVIQNGIKVDYGNFTANTPIQFIYDRDVDTLYGKSFDVLVYITKNTGSTNDEIVFSKDIHAESKPCEWVVSTEWGFTLGEGKYRMNITVKDSNSTDSESYTDFTVKPNVIMSNYVSPLKQFKSGIAAKDVKCKEGLQFIMKNENGQPACVTPHTFDELITRGWGIMPLGGLPIYHSTSIFDTGIHPFSINVENANFTLNYYISGNNKLSDANMDSQSKSLILSLQSTNNGTLIISIPRALLDIKKNDRGMGEFYILVDGQETTFKEIHTTLTDRIFSIPFLNGTKNIEIIASELI